MARSKQRCVLHDTRISALSLDQHPEPVEPGAAVQRPAASSRRRRRRSRARQSGEMAGQIEAELGEPGVTIAAEHLDRLADLDRVADGVGQGWLMS